MQALQDSQARVAALEAAGSASVAPPAPAPSPSPSLVDMPVLGKPANFSGDRESWRSWSFTVKAFAAALSPDLRQLMDAASATPNNIQNAAMTADEQKWSRQLYYMMSLTTNGEALRRLQHVAEGEGAEAWRVFSDH